MREMAPEQRSFVNDERPRQFQVTWMAQLRDGFVGELGNERQAKVWRGKMGVMGLALEGL
jgi:hypothetical protein